MACAGSHVGDLIVGLFAEGLEGPGSGRRTGAGSGALVVMDKSLFYNLDELATSPYNREQRHLSGRDIYT